MGLSRNRQPRHLARETVVYCSRTSFQLGSGSYSVIAAAVTDVRDPRFFAYTRP